jgi:hypothetical protein
MNYGQLKTLIGNFAKRTEADVGAFVSFAHAIICTEFEAPDSLLTAMHQGPALPVGNSVYSYPLPSDALRVREVWTGGWALSNATAQELQQVTGSNPVLYAVEGLNLLVAPGEASELMVSYQKRLPDLIADTDSNWMLENYPQLYLYGSLVQLHQYVQDDEQVAMAQTLYDQAAAYAGQQIQQLKQGGQPIIRSA